MLNQPEGGGGVTRIRRRPTRRHRRNRRIRLVLLLTVSVVLTLSFSSVALRYLSPSLFKASQNEEPDRQSVENTRDRFLAVQRAALSEFEKRPVYRYSVVPGGVRSVQELKRAAERDPVVALHYAGFDFNHAQVVRLALARSAYVSYRIGNRVFWTHHQVTLKKGESLITDGKITARTRCANRVEETPQQENSQSEPPVAKFEELVSPKMGTAIESPPAPFQSALANRGPVGSLGPALPLGMYDPLGGGQGWVPITPPPLPSVCGVGGKKPKTSGIESASASKKKKFDPCGSGGSVGVVPEPGTWLLVASGLVFMFWKARDKFVRT